MATSMNAVLIAIVLFAPLTGIAAAARAADATAVAAAKDECPGCGALRAAARRLKEVGRQDYDRQVALVEGASDAIEALPYADGKRWSREQVEAVVALLAAAAPYDGYYSIPQVSTERFTVHRKELLEAAHRLPAAQAADVERMIQIGLSDPAAAEPGGESVKKSSSAVPVKSAKKHAGR